jgi:hypothetical protein
MSIGIAAFRLSHRPSKKATWASVLLWASAAARNTVSGPAQLRSGMPGPADEGAQAPARPVDPKGQQGGGAAGSVALRRSRGWRAGTQAGVRGAGTALGTIQWNLDHHV